MTDDKVPERPPYLAPSREGKKRITVITEPAEHLRLKRLALDHERSIEELMREALADLLAKYDA